MSGSQKKFEIQPISPTIWEISARGGFEGKKAVYGGTLFPLIVRRNLPEALLRSKSPKIPLFDY